MEDHPQGKPQGFFLRMKKFVAAKMSGTRGGRAVIRSFLGTEGHQLMMISIDLMQRFTTQEKVDEIQTHFYKIVSKIGILIREGVVSEESLDTMRTPNGIFAAAIMNQLAMPSDARDVTMCIKLLRDAIDKMIVELHQFIKDKGVSRILVMLEFFSSEGFFNFLLKDPSNEKPCDMILALVGTLLDEGRGSPQVVLGLKATKRKLQIKLNSLRYILNNSSAEAFLHSSNQGLMIFWDWILSRDSTQEPNLLGFYMACTDMQDIAFADVQAVRCRGLLNKYVVVGSPSRLDFGEEHAGLLEAVEEQLLELDESEYHTGLLSGVVSTALSQLEALFPLFKESEEYLQLIREYEHAEKVMHMIDSEDLKEGDGDEDDDDEKTINRKSIISGLANLRLSVKI
jgi:hypothetical protein